MTLAWATRSFSFFKQIFFSAHQLSSLTSKYFLWFLMSASALSLTWSLQNSRSKSPCADRRRKFSEIFYKKFDWGEVRKRKIFKVALHVLSEKPKRLKNDFDLYWFTKNAKCLLINQNDKWLHYSVMLTLHIKNLIEWGWFNQYSSCFFKRWQWGPTKIAWNSDTMAIWPAISILNS